MLDRIAISGTEYPFSPIAELFQMTKYLGVKNLELWLPHNFKYEELESVRDKLKENNLKAICISTWTQLNLPGEVTERQILIKKSIEAAKFLDAQIVNTYFGGNPDRTPKQAIQKYKQNILPCLEVAEKNNILIVLENEFELTGTDITRKAELVFELAEEIDSDFFGLTYDPCNFYFAGEEPYPFAFNILKKHIRYIHIKNGMKFHPNLYKHPGDSYLWRDKSGNYICSGINEGAIPYRSMLSRLQKEKYSGYLTLEPHVPHDVIKETFEMSLNYIKREINIK